MLTSGDRKAGGRTEPAGWRWRRIAGFCCLPILALTVGLAPFGRVGLAAGWGTPAGAGAAPRDRLPPPDHITTPGQAALRERMGHHGATMSTLVRAVVLLDRPTVQTMALRIADEETIAHLPRRRLLPSELLAEQSVLQAAARRLAVAARGDDDVELADRFAALTRTRPARAGTISAMAPQGRGRHAT